MSTLDALIDSGTIDNFLSLTIVQYFKFPTKKLNQPKTICNVDGIKNIIRKVTQAVDLSMKFLKNQRQQVIHIQTFSICRSGKQLHAPKNALSIHQQPHD